MRNKKKLLELGLITKYYERKKVNQELICKK